MVNDKDETTLPECYEQLAKEYMEKNKELEISLREVKLDVKAILLICVKLMEELGIEKATEFYTNNKLKFFTFKILMERYKMVPQFDLNKDEDYKDFGDKCMKDLIQEAKNLFEEKLKQKK